MITLTVRVFKRVGTKFPLFHFKSRRINLEVQFAILYEMLVMLTLVWAIAFNIFWTLNPTCKNRMSPLPVVFTLRNSEVYVCSIDGSNVASNIEAPIN